VAHGECEACSLSGCGGTIGCCLPVGKRTESEPVPIKLAQAFEQATPRPPHFVETVETAE
jgi:hypothetical protein